MCQKHEKEENDDVTESSWVVLLFYIEVPESHLTLYTSCFD